MYEGGLATRDKSIIDITFQLGQEVHPIQHYHLSRTTRILFLYSSQLTSLYKQDFWRHSQTLQPQRLHVSQSCCLRMTSGWKEATGCQEGGIWKVLGGLHRKERGGEKCKGSESEGD